MDLNPERLPPHSGAPVPGRYATGAARRKGQQPPAATDRDALLSAGVYVPDLEG